MIYLLQYLVEVTTFEKYEWMGVNLRREDILERDACYGRTCMQLINTRAEQKKKKKFYIKVEKNQNSEFNDQNFIQNH